MFHLQRIESLELPELAPYRTMRRPMDHRLQGIFVAEGEKVVRRLLESEFPVVSVVLPEKWVETYTPLLTARPEPDIPVFVVTKKHVLEELTGFSMYQGVMAVGKIPPQPAIENLLASSLHPRLWIALEGLTNAENLGAIVRSCAAFGVQTLVTGETSSSPYLRRAVRNSMGTLFRLPVVETGDLRKALTVIREHGIRCVAAHPRADGGTVSDISLSGDCCIVLGSEGYGISPSILEVCDDHAAIPMAPGVDSLNVGAAAAVFLYEANRQRSFAMANGVSAA